MSLEIALQENTAAINKLLAAWEQLKQIATARHVQPEDKASKKATAPQPQPEIAVGDAADAKATVAKNGASSTPEARESSPVEAAAQVKADPVPVEQSQEPGAAGVTEPTYQDTAAYITRLSREKGRDVAVALLKEFNAAKLPDVAATDFAAIIARADELLGA